MPKFQELPRRNLSFEGYVTLVGFIVGFEPLGGPSNTHISAIGMQFGMR